jgi:hypothetical protein
MVDEHCDESYGYISIWIWELRNIIVILFTNKYLVLCLV